LIGHANLKKLRFDSSRSSGLMVRCKGSAVRIALFSLGFVTLAHAQVPPTPSGSGPAGPKPRLVAPQRTIELGNVVAGDKVQVKWLLRNEGDAALQIERTVATCGCTVVYLTDEEKVLAPGGQLELKADFNSAGRKGEQVKTVVVHSNDPAEPQLELQFRARVDVLYEMNPPGRFGFRAAQRGESPKDTFDITPGEGRKDIELLEVRIKDPSLISYKAEALPTPTGVGHRIRLTLSDSAPVGYLSSGMTLTIRVGDLTKEIYVPIQGEIVEDLTPSPKVVQPSGYGAPPGKQLAPVVLRSVSKTPFEIRGADAGDLLNVSFEEASGKPPKTEYTFTLSIRPDAPAGPFGALLEIRTDAVSQPLIRVPVFGIVTSPVMIDPPIVVLRSDGTTAGSQRRVRVQTIPQQILEVSSLKPDQPYFSVALDAQDESQPSNVRYLDIRLNGAVPAGVQQAALTFTTNVPGAEVVRVPVQIENPG
jgi:hypothetical protein